MNYRDVALVNSSLSDLGNSLLQQKMMEQRAQENLATRADRQAQIGLEAQRAKTAESRNEAMQQHWATMEAGQQSAAAKTATAQDIRDKTAMLQTVIGLNAAGQLDNLDDVNEWLSSDDHLGKTGIQLKPPPAKPPPQAGQNALAKAYQQADTFRQQANDADDPGDVDRYNGYADSLEKWANLQANPAPKTAPGLQATVTTDERGKTTRTLKGPADQIAAATPGTPQTTVNMINPQGVTVAAPVARVQELTAKGYRLAPGSE
jgi:hypothetical protein